MTSLRLLGSNPTEAKDLKQENGKVLVGRKDVLGVEAIIRGRDTCTPTGVGQSSMQGDEQGALLHQA